MLSIDNCPIPAAVLSQSGANQLLQGMRVSYGNTATFRAGVGDKARADARIILEGLRNILTQQRTQASNYVVWQHQLNQGTKNQVDFYISKTSNK